MPRARSTRRRPTPSAQEISAAATDYERAARDWTVRLDAGRADVLDRLATFGTMTVAQLGHDLLRIPTLLLPPEPLARLLDIVRRLAADGLASLEELRTQHTVLRPERTRCWEVVRGPADVSALDADCEASRNLTSAERAVLALPRGRRFEESWICGVALRSISAARNQRQVLHRLENLGFIRRHEPADASLVHVASITAKGYERAGRTAMLAPRFSHLGHHLLAVEAALRLRGPGEIVESFAGDESLRASTRAGVDFKALSGRRAEPLPDAVVRLSRRPDPVPIEVITGKYSTAVIEEKLRSLPPTTVFVAATDQVFRRAAALGLRLIHPLDFRLSSSPDPFADASPGAGPAAPTTRVEGSQIERTGSAELVREGADRAPPGAPAVKIPPVAGGTSDETDGPALLDDRVLRFLAYTQAATSDQLFYEFSGRFGRRRETVAAVLSRLQKRGLVTARLFDRTRGRASPLVYQLTRRAAERVGGEPGNGWVPDRQLQLLVQRTEVLQVRARDGWRLFLPASEGFALLWQLLPLERSFKRLGPPGAVALPFDIIARPAKEDLEGEARLLIVACESALMRQRLRALPIDMNGFESIPYEFVGANRKDLGLFQRDVRAVSDPRGPRKSSLPAARDLSAMRLAEDPVAPVSERRSLRQMEPEERPEVMTDPVGWEPWHPDHRRESPPILRADQQRDEKKRRDEEARNGAGGGGPTPASSL